jgi:uncharacterized protein
MAPGSGGPGANAFSAPDLARDQAGSVFDGDMRRVVTWAVGLLVVLIVVFYVGGGWYFSGQIESGALDVRHSDPFPLAVVALAGDRVTLEVQKGAAKQPALNSDMTYGLAWDGGYGQVFGAPSARSGGGVTRRLRMLEGSKPRAGERARLDRDAFPGDDPTLSVGKPVRVVRYSAGGHTFPAWFARGHGHTWVVFVHGSLGADREEPLRAMRVTARLGMPSLDITYRNDLGAPQDPSGQYQYGRTEWRDLQGAVRYALSRGARHVVLVGYSMGGAVTAAFLENSKLASRVTRVVFDAPMLDLRTVIEYGASQRSLPVIGKLPASLTWSAEEITSLRDGVDWDATDYVDDTGWLKVPTLVFHGTDDLRVPLSLSRTLARDHPATVTLKVVKGAGHVESWNVDPRTYDNALARFLRAA